MPSPGRCVLCNSTGFVRIEIDANHFACAIIWPRWTSPRGGSLPVLFMLGMLLITSVR